MDKRIGKNNPGLQQIPGNWRTTVISEGRKVSSYSIGSGSDVPEDTPSSTESNESVLRAALLLPTPRNTFRMEEYPPTSQALVGMPYGTIRKITAATSAMSPFNATANASTVIQKREQDSVGDLWSVPEQRAEANVVQLPGVGFRSQSTAAPTQWLVENSPEQIFESKTVKAPVVGLRPHSTPFTMQWLVENYQHAEGVSIPRHVVYNQYSRFCQKNRMVPVNAASFGKIIRQRFHMVKNRRLGTRGCSTYHYHGIGILPNSTFYQEQILNSSNNNSSSGSSLSPMAQGSTLQRQEASKPQQASKPAASSTLCTDRAVLAPHCQNEMCNSFIAMYRAHCQSLYDSIILTDHREVHGFILHFWNGIPVNLKVILGTSLVINMVGICDSSLYGSISDVLFPNIHKMATVRHFELMNNLASKFEIWLNDALTNVPIELRKLKLKLARNFCRGIRCLTSLNKLCNSGHLLENPGVLAQMLLDFRSIDLTLICNDIVYYLSRENVREDTQTIIRLFAEFERLLELQASVQQFLHWMDSIIERFVVQVAIKRSRPSTQVARRFLLVWVRIGTHILRDLTLFSAHSFGSYHLLEMIFKDYLTHCIDILVIRAQAEEMKKNLALNTPTSTFKGIIKEEIKVECTQVEYTNSGYESSSQKQIFDYQVHQERELLEIQGTSTQQSKLQVSSSPYYETSVCNYKIASQSASMPNGPVQNFMYRQMPSDNCGSSDMRHGYQELHPSCNQNNPQPRRKEVTIAPSTELVSVESSIDTDTAVLMYPSSTNTATNYHSAQYYVVPSAFHSN